MSFVQFNGDFAEVESKYPSLTLWADGEGRVFFEEDNEKHYLEYGDYIVLRNGKHYVETAEPDEDATTASDKTVATYVVPKD